MCKRKSEGLDFARARAHCRFAFSAERLLGIIHCQGCGLKVGLLDKFARVCVY